MSPPRFQLGLVVGKFSPLHLGHEGLIAHAATQCQRLLLLSYSQPELPRCGAAQRRAWLARRCPQHEAIVLDAAELQARCQSAGLPARRLPRNDAPDPEQQDFLAWLLRDVLRQRPDAMFCNEAYGPACVARLSVAFQQPVALVMPDLQRQAHPISGTALRQARWPALAHIAPEVAADWVPRIALLGGESSGKTTLAAALADALGGAWVPEFGRTWWTQRGGHLAPDDLLRIARTQVAHEEQACLALPRLLIGDTSPLTTLGYSLWTFGRAEPALVRLARRPYDALILCLGDFPFQQDGTRRNAGFRSTQEAWYRAALARAACPTLEVGGSLRQRVRRVRAFLQAQGWVAPGRWPGQAAHRVR